MGLLVGILGGRLLIPVKRFHFLYDVEQVVLDIPTISGLRPRCLQMKCFQPFMFCVYAAGCARTCVSPVVHRVLDFSNPL